MGLQVDKLKKYYDDFSLNVSFRVRQGEFISLLGPSGSGKTTVLRLIAGILTPDSGLVCINGKDATNIPPNLRNVGVVFQNNALFPHMNVFQNIAYGPRAKKWPSEEVEKEVERLLHLVNLNGYKKRKISELSGGEMQRVALARALAANPSVILFDEPLSSLDASLRIFLRKEIRRIQKELGITALYVTHDQEEALAISDRVVVLKGGRIEQAGKPEDLYNNPASLFVGEFIGRGNALYGKVVGELSSRQIVRTDIGDFLVNSPFGTGSEVVLFFRPEHVLEGNRSENTFKGRVVQSEYHGKSYLHEVEAGSGKIQWEYNMSFEERGPENLSFSIASEKIRVFLKEGKVSL